MVDDAAILAATLEPPPDKLAVAHWSTRLLAGELVSGTPTVARSWRRYGIKPWRRDTFKFSTDSQLQAKVRDVVGLYLNPPQKAVVLCVDEKSQIQALDRTAPILPLRPALPEKADSRLRAQWHHNAVRRPGGRHGKVTDACYDRHGKAEFGDFLKKVARAYPRRELHVVFDNYDTHVCPERGVMKRCRRSLSMNRAVPVMEVGPPGSPSSRGSQTAAVSCRSRAGVGSDCGKGPLQRVRYATRRRTCVNHC